MKALEKIFAEKLLKVKAIKLQPENPFTWASGWRSPFYCDNRKTLSYPELRSFVKTELARVILENFDDVDAIAGVAPGAIAQGALVADMLNKPFVYVRSKPKDHGLENLIEGELKPGMKVVVVEDLISTGGSSPVAAGYIKNKIESMLPDYYGKMINALGGIRNRVLVSIDTYDKRKHFFTELIEYGEKHDGNIPDELVITMLDLYNGDPD